ncbi:hypothetical protein OAG75_01870, partial [bacterium]|nr:hypothetical protein [bacterium]
HIPEKKSSRIILLDVVELNANEADRVLKLNPGQTQQVDGRMLVKTGDGVVEVLQLQPAGKRPMSSEQFLCGTNIENAQFAGDNQS